MKHHLCPPEWKPTTILFGLAIFLCGCSSSYLVSSTGMPDAQYSYREMNEELKGRDVKIEIKNLRYISAKEVKISDDSVSWVDQRTNQKFKASIRQLDKIVVKNHFLGALEGLGLGLVGGAGAGAAALSSTNFSGPPGWYVGLILGGPVGGGTGLIIGAIKGHSYNYEFPTTEQSDSSRK